MELQKKNPFLSLSSLYITESYSGPIFNLQWIFLWKEELCLRSLSLEIVGMSYFFLIFDVMGFVSCIFFNMSFFFLFFFVFFCFFFGISGWERRLWWISILYTHKLFCSTFYLCKLMHDIWICCNWIGNPLLYMFCGSLICCLDMCTRSSIDSIKLRSVLISSRRNFRLMTSWWLCKWVI